MLNGNIFLLFAKTILIYFVGFTYTLCTIHVNLNDWCGIVLFHFDNSGHDLICIKGVLSRRFLKILFALYKLG